MRLGFFPVVHVFEDIGGGERRQWKFPTIISSILTMIASSKKSTPQGFCWFFSLFHSVLCFRFVSSAGEVQLLLPFMFDSVCIDNETYDDCTLVKVESANKNGLLLEMVQVLADLDLVITKSYISTDGGWIMDVFHVTDQMGNKLKDQSLMRYIKQALCATRRASPSKEIPSPEYPSRHLHMPSDHTAIEMTTTDQPGLLSKITAVLAEQACDVADMAVWTHHTRAAFIFYIKDNGRVGPITDPERLARIEEELENIVEANDKEGERRSVRLATPVPGRTHTERRLHQLMFADKDYEMCCSCCGGSNCDGGECGEANVSIGSWEEKGYSVINVKCRDRPKLLFDAVCTLTDMQYVVFHASIRSEGSIAKHEYFIRHKDGCTLSSDEEKEKLANCLLASIERRFVHGLRLDVSADNRPHLLSEMTRTMCENDLKITRVDLTTQGKKVVGSFYVEGTSGPCHEVNLKTIEIVKKGIDGCVQVVNGSNNSGNWSRRTIPLEEGSWDGNNSDDTNKSKDSSNVDANINRGIVSSTITSNNNDNKSKQSPWAHLWAELAKFPKIFGPIGFLRCFFADFV
ncbi:hypothetical protein MLD38_031375 [Melastoma candidum]|uniref:Uncharacterized protein n=1 Tax=Melastoma candidum TaxID=119954 RepID=A0ACB9MPH2_9MYRT|nr:hypothetical protein MLD38_031375 [Melastoma candidum]